MEQNPQIILTPADFTDTGQWRLIIYISHSGMRAFLMHLTDKSRPILKLVSTNWRAEDPISLLNHIESAIYDNPALLDDYATDIILETPQVCFVPQQYIFDVDKAETDIFAALFPGESKEILTDSFGKLTVLFSMVRGLDGFFSRTIPGARIRSHLAVMVENFSSNASADAPAIYADIRDNEMDLILLEGKNLLSASVQYWQAPEDIAYRIFNLLNAYKINPALTKINLSGNQKQINFISPLITKFCGEICQTPLPVNPGGNDPLPTAALLLAFKKA